ncbi:MAG: hypothetical protein AAFW60_07955 [Pseudomonadota bacterium]
MSHATPKLLFIISDLEAKIMIRNIPLELVDPNPDQPRKTFDAQVKAWKPLRHSPPE